jgi:hypothetical protein
VFKRYVQEGDAGLGEDFLAVSELAVDPDPAPAAVCDPRVRAQDAVDEHGPPVADEHPGGHGREAVPRGEQAACLVERRADQAAMGDPRGGLMSLREREVRLVALDPLLGGKRKVDAVRIVPAPPARRVVVGRKLRRYRSPPRSKWAL